MCSKIITIIGLIIALSGTIITFMRIFTTQIENLGTWGAPLNAKNDFIKERRWVYIGLSLIVLGTVLQIVGTVLAE